MVREGASGVTARVTTAAGTHINVRKDELERYLAANPGAVVDAAPEEPIEEPAVEPVEEAAPRRGRRAATKESAEDDSGARE